MSSERRGVELVLDSMGAFRSVMLRMMVAVRRRWLQRGGGEEVDGRRLETMHARLSEVSGMDETLVRDEVDEGEFAGERKPAKAEENNMKTNELQTILGYLNIGLAIAHNTGVSVGHFGSTDFIQLAEMVNNLFLNAITPVASSVPVAATVAAVSVAPIVINAPAAASVAVAG